MKALLARIGWKAICALFALIASGVSLGFTFNSRITACETRIEMKEKADDKQDIEVNRRLERIENKVDRILEGKQ